MIPTPAEAASAASRMASLHRIMFRAPIRIGTSAESRTGRGVAFAVIRVQGILGWLGTRFGPQRSREDPVGVGEAIEVDDRATRISEPIAFAAVAVECFAQAGRVPAR